VKLGLNKGPTTKPPKWFKNSQKLNIGGGKASGSSRFHPFSLSQGR